MTFNVVNSYTGGTTVNAGTVKLGRAGGLPSGYAVSVNGGTLDINGKSPTPGGVTLASGQIVDRGGGGAITGTSYTVSAARSAPTSTAEAL